MSTSIFGTEGDDRFTLSGDNEIFFGLQGNDVFSFLGDFLGNNTIDGGDGFDTIVIIQPNANITISNSDNVDIGNFGVIEFFNIEQVNICLLYTSPSPRDS